MVIEGLFRQDQFLWRRARGEDELVALLERERRDFLIAIVDLDIDRPDAIIRALRVSGAHAVVVGLTRAHELPVSRALLDAVFLRPVAAERLRSCVLEQATRRRAGNELFDRIASELHMMIPRADARALLERVLEQRSLDPQTVRRLDLARVLASGLVEVALAPFASDPVIRKAMQRAAGHLGAEGAA